MIANPTKTPTRAAAAQQPSSPAVAPAAPRPDLSIVLVGWNNKKYLEPCLDSLYGGGLKSTFDVVVVDNGSTDGSQAMLRTRFPDVIIVQNDHNVGLGKASNQGIEATNGRHVLLLNNDTIVNGPSLDAMVEFLDANPHAGAVGGKLLNPDGTVQSCYNNFSTLGEEFLVATRLGDRIRDGYPAIMEGDDVKSVEWIGSACLTVRRAALDQIGLLDEEYFIYGDEADLQFRLIRGGWKIYYLPYVTTIHYGGRSMTRWGRRKMVYRGKMLFYKKNYGPGQTAALRLMVGALSMSKLIVWKAASVSSKYRAQAAKEIESNLDVVKLCCKLE